MKKVLLFLLCSFSVIFLKCRNSQLNLNKETSIVSNDGIDLESGLHLDENMMLVKGQCTGCHSAKLITMNRFTREGWLDKIRWMQKTQNLWDLGEAEPAVLDYLEKYYAPQERVSRRSNLENIEWYKLESN